MLSAMECINHLPAHANCERNWSNAHGLQIACKVTNDKQNVVGLI